MAQLPSMEQILKEGARRESRTELVLGTILVVGGLSFVLGLRHIGYELKIPTFGAIGLGVGLVIRGLFRGRR